MAIGSKIWHSIIDLIIFTMLGVFIVVYGIIALSLPDVETAGILTLLFDLASLNPRDFTPSGLNGGCGIVQNLQSEVPCITKTAPSVASESQTLAFNASDAALDSAMPRNCTLGTTYFSLGYVNNVTNSRLPLNISGLLSRILPVSISSKLSSLESLDQELKFISSGTITGPFILGIISTVILITAFQYAFWKRPIYSSSSRGVPLEIALGVIVNSVCILSFIFPTIVLRILYSKTDHLPFNITVERGKLWSNCITILCCAVAMTFCTVSMSLRKCLLLKKR